MEIRTAKLFKMIDFFDFHDNFIGRYKSEIMSVHFVFWVRGFRLTCRSTRAGVQMVSFVQGKMSHRCLNLPSSYCY
jgi:hypothetical protein